MGYMPYDMSNNMMNGDMAANGSMMNNGMMDNSSMMGTTDNGTMMQ